MMSSSRDEVSAMQVETDDFILSLTSVGEENDEHTEVITTEVSDLPPDLVNTDVADLANNPSLWLGLEGALESNDAVSNMSNVSGIVEEHVQTNESAVHLGNDPNNLNMNDLGHSEEVETMTIEAMEVDVQNMEVSRSQEVHSIPLESFMDQSDMGISIMTSQCDDKNAPSITPMSVSLPVVEPVTRTVFPLGQIKKTIPVSSSTQVTKVVLAPTSQNQTGQPLLLTVPASTSGLTSLLTPNTNLRFVNALSTDGSKMSTIGTPSSNIHSQSVRLMSPTKTITLQQAQQLGLISPKKGQPLIVNKVAVATASQGTPTTNILAGKQGAKFAGGNVTLVRSAPTKTPTKIAPAPPQTVASNISSSSSIQSQPTSLLIKNAAGQVTMAALVQTRPNGGNVTNMNPLSPQKFVLRPSAPGPITAAQVRQGSGTQPAQYIRLTTAQALAAGILPAIGTHGEQSGQQQHFQLAGNKIQLVRVVNPSAGNNGSGNLVTASGTSKVIIGAPTANSIKIHSANSSLAQQTVKGTTTLTKAVGQVKGAISTVNVPPGAQRIILPAGSMGSLASGLVMVPAQYTSQSSIGVSGSPATVNFSTITTSAATVVSDSVASPVVSSVSTTSRLSQQPKAAPPPSPESAQMSASASQAKAQSVLESNGLKPRKPCNCTKSQCLKLYCDCFANGEFCHGCNCVCCANNLEHEELRLRAIRSCLDRNPHAFKPKIGVGWGPEPRRHNKGCHCKRSGCLKNYCECYEAKIACSAICKCIGCKNCVDPAGSPPGPGEKRLSKMAALQTNPSSSGDSRTVSNPASHNSKQEDRTTDPPKGFSIPTAAGSSRPPFSFITQEVVEATCQCLLAQAEEAERLCKTSTETEGLVLEEFGRCLLQIIEYASKAKVSASP
ncbi:protein lin-54 homolog isoform X1 [Daphnia pulex]|uniref:protein lin-54 homolog isoform X1 n=1 Tax=Daphnia pulex TaxID=6669 RepID=UPI001EDD62D0|nr:protein lin-54 homolog isoform X1 [Daphnia pulex]